ncbi:MAG: hypothetical protein WCP97_01240 [bacterium]
MTTLVRKFVFSPLIEGLCRMVDFSGAFAKSYDEYYAQPNETEALKNDWKAVGKDIRSALNSVEDQLHDGK